MFLKIHAKNNNLNDKNIAFLTISLFVQLETRKICFCIYPFYLNTDTIAYVIITAKITYSEVTYRLSVVDKFSWLNKACDIYLNNITKRSTLEIL